MIHLMANSNQQQGLYQNLAQQPPVQIPNPQQNQNNNNNNSQRHNNNNNNKNNGGKRQRNKEKEDDWDICWDYLSPKGCNRDVCRWRHGNPKIDQRQIAKRRRRYLDRNRNRDNNNRRRKHNNNNNNNNNNKQQHHHRQPNNHNQHPPSQQPYPNNIWNQPPPHHLPMGAPLGAPPPPPYYAPPPPTMPQPHNNSQNNNTNQDLAAQYAQYYNQMMAQMPQNQKNNDKKGSAYMYPPHYGYNGYYAPYGYGHGYPHYPYMQQQPQQQQQQQQQQAGGTNVVASADNNDNDNKDDNKDNDNKNDLSDDNKDNKLNNDPDNADVAAVVKVDDDNKDDIHQNDAQNSDKKDNSSAPYSFEDPYNDPGKNSNQIQIITSNNNSNTIQSVNNNNIDNINNNTQQQQEQKQKQEEYEEDIDLKVVNPVNCNQTISNSASQGAGKSLNDNIINKEDKIFNTQNDNIHNNNPSPSLSSTARECPIGCECDICQYKNIYQIIPKTNPFLNTIDKAIPVRHPMFDDPHNPILASFMGDENDKNDDNNDDDIDIDIHNSNQPLHMNSSSHLNNNIHQIFPKQSLEYNIQEKTKQITNNQPVNTNPSSNNSQYVFQTDPETGGLVPVLASNIAQQTPQQIPMAPATVPAQTTNSNVYYDQATGQYIDLASGAVNMPSPMQNMQNVAFYAANQILLRQQQLQLQQQQQQQQINNINNSNDNDNNADNLAAPVFNKPRSKLQLTLNETKKKKKKKKKTKKKKKIKKKGINSSIKWLYIIHDTKRECYGSLCRGQFDSITTTKWLTSLYEEASWGNYVKDRSRTTLNNGPSTNHISWYTLPGCNCTLLDDNDDDYTQDDKSTHNNLPSWLKQITDNIMTLCQLQNDSPNCIELFYFANKSCMWNWHSYCENSLFGINDKIKKHKHQGQSVHLLIGNRRQFKFAPRKTKAIPGDEEKSVYIENGDILITCGNFANDYVVKIDSEDDPNFYNNNNNNNNESRAHSSMYIVWRWIVNHNKYCSHNKN